MCEASQSQATGTASHSVRLPRTISTTRLPAVNPLTRPQTSPIQVSAVPLRPFYHARNPSYREAGCRPGTSGRDHEPGREDRPRRPSSSARSISSSTWSSTWPAAVSRSSSRSRRPAGQLARRPRRPAAVAILLVYLAIAAGIFGIGLLIVPPLVDGVEELSEDLPGYVDDLRENETFREYDDRYDITEKLQDQAETCRASSATRPARSATSPSASSRASCSCSRSSSSPSSC